MTRYLLDGRSLGDGSATRGIGTYLRGLLRGLASQGVAGDVSLLLERGVQLPGDVAAAGFATHPRRLPALNRHVRPLLDTVTVRAAIAAPRPSLYHAIEYAQPLFPSVPVVVTVHDLIPFVMPRDYPWMRRERAIPLRQLRHADAVIAVSRSTAHDLERIADVDPARIVVIPEGVTVREPHEAARLEAMRARLRVPSRFVLAVGTFDPRKRIGALADVVRRLREHHDVSLVIAGNQGNFAAAVDSQLASAGISEHTHLLGYVSEDDLAGLYQLAECLLFTSAYEGFGLPPLEAMAFGTPVAVFDNSSLREVVDGAALVVTDGDAAAMAAAVAALLDDAGERLRLARSGRERARALSWDNAGAATLALYRAVLDAR